MNIVFINKIIAQHVQLVWTIVKRRPFFCFRLFYFVVGSNLLHSPCC